MSITVEFAKGGEVGVAKTIKTEGDGPKPSIGDVCKVKWSGYLDDGHVVTSGNAEVTVGRRQLFGTGADLGLLSMRAGERAFVTCEREFSDSYHGARLTLDMSLETVMTREAAAARENQMIINGLKAFAVLVVIAFFLTR